VKSILAIIIVVVHHLALSQNKLPESNGHVFVPVIGVKNAQPVTSFASIIGFSEAADLNLQLAELDDGEIIGLTGDLIFINFGVSTSIRVKEWISFNIKYGLTTRLGTDVESLLSQGFTKLDATETSWQVKILRSQKFFFSGIVGLNRFEAEFVEHAEGGNT